MKSASRLLTHIQDAINGRTQAAKWYAALAKDSSGSNGSSIGESNSSRQYFLKVLQQVFEILRKEHKSRRPKRKKAMPVLASDTNDLTDLYQHLEIEDTSLYVGPVTSALAPKSKKTSAKAGKGQEYELDNEKEEKLFEIWCLLSDLFEIRAYARSVWSSYNAGEISLIAACKMTENTMTMGYSLSSSFKKRHEDLRSFDRIIHFIGAGSFYLGAVYRQINYDIARRSGQDHKEPSAVEWSDLLCVHAWRGLSDFRDLQDYVWMSEGAHRKTYGDKKPLFKYPGHPFSKILANLAFQMKAAFPDMARFVMEEKGEMHSHDIMSTLDAFTLEMFCFCRTRKMSTGHVSASQVYLEMYDALDGDMGRCFRELGELIERAEVVRIESASRYSGKHFENWKFFPRPGKDDHGNAGWLIPLAPDVEEKLGEEVRYLVPEGFLSTPPGTRISSCLQDVVRAPAGDSQTSRHRLDNCERHLSLQGCTTLWIHRRILGRYGLFHRSAGSFVQNLMERREKHAFARQPLRPIPWTFHLESLMWSGAQTSKPEYAAKAMEKPGTHCRYMDAYCDTMEDTCDIGLETDMRMFYRMVAGQALSSKGIQDETIAEQWKETRRLSPVQLLQVAQEILIEDDPHIHFDYYGFSGRCSEWLQLAGTCFSSAAKRTQTRSLLTHPYRYSAVHAVLWESAMAEMRGIPSEETSLREIGRLAQTFFKTDDPGCKRRSLELSSGHIPNGRKPSVLHPKVSTESDTQVFSYIDYATQPPMNMAGPSRGLAEEIRSINEMLAKSTNDAMTEDMVAQGCDIGDATELGDGQAIFEELEQKITELQRLYEEVVLRGGVMLQ